MSKFKSYGDAAPTRFEVGDRVVTYDPIIVCDPYAGIVGRVEEVFKDNIHIKYPDGEIQICYPEDDNLQHAPEMEMPVVDKKPVVSNVEHPSHYGQGTIEAIEYIKDFLTEEEFIGYLRGNVAKYMHRWRYKNGLEDLKKAQVYLRWIVEVVERD